jgi:8-hydroxy-5-deazaflavin:NADPH oxidoreductase
MKVGVLGTGDAGRALGKAFITLGHEVMLAGRERDNPKTKAWATEMGSNASSGTFGDACSFGELIVLCTLGAANADVIRSVDAQHLDGKIVIDTTNPLDFSRGFPPGLLPLAEGSGGEQVQALLPRARVVKAFNTAGNPYMFRPDFPGGPPTMFFCGNDPEAREAVGKLLETFGWIPSDLGALSASHYLEAMCIVWVLHGKKTGGWNHVFKMLQK